MIRTKEQVIKELRVYLTKLNRADVEWLQTPPVSLRKQGLASGATRKSYITVGNRIVHCSMLANVGVLNSERSRGKWFRVF